MGAHINIIISSVTKLLFLFQRRKVKVFLGPEKWEIVEKTGIVRTYSNYLLDYFLTPTYISV